MPVHLAFILHLIVTAAALAALYRWYPSRRLATAHTVLIIVVLLGFETLSIRATWPSQALWDFQACYYPAGDAVLHHDLAKLADLYRRTVQGFVNMPIIAFLFSPFALLGATSGSVVYTAAGGAAAVAAWYLLVRLADLRQRERWILALLFVANGPLINGLKFGNTSQFILLALAAGLALLRGNRAAAAGVLLGVVAVLKPAMGLFGVFFLLRRDFRGLAGFMAAGAVLTLLSIAVFGWSFNLFWFQTSILQFGHQWFSAFSVQSIPGFILRFRSDPALMTNWQPVVPTHSEQLTAQALIGLLYLIAATACFSARHLPLDRGEPAVLVPLLLLVAGPNRIFSRCPVPKRPLQPRTGLACHCAGHPVGRLAVTTLKSDSHEGLPLSRFVASVIWWAGMVRLNRQVTCQNTHRGLCRAHDLTCGSDASLIIQCGLSEACRPPIRQRHVRQMT
jgi:hypothetical protein